MLYIAQPPLVPLVLLCGVCCFFGWGGFLCCFFPSSPFILYACHTSSMLLLSFSWFLSVMLVLYFSCLLYSVFCFCHSAHSNSFLACFLCSYLIMLFVAVCVFARLVYIFYFPFSLCVSLLLFSSSF